MPIGLYKGSYEDYLIISRLKIHFTQIRRRILKVKPSVGNLNLDNNNNNNDDDNNNSNDNNDNNNEEDDDNKPMTLIVDGCIRSYHNKEKRLLHRTKNGSGRKKSEFIKLHIAVDAKSKKVVSFRVTKGNIHS